MDFRIEILDAISNMPDAYKQDGSIFLDIEQMPSIEESSGSVSDISKVGSVTVSDLTLKFSAVNDIVLERWRKPYIDETKSINIHCTKGVNYIPFDRLTVTNVNFESRTYSVQLQLSENHWLTKAENTTLNNLTSLGQYEFSKSLVTGSWSTQQALYFPLIQYNNLKNLTKGVRLSDFRPWIQLKWLLEQAFCGLGFAFSCPFLDTTFGQTLYAYMLGEFRSQELLDQRKFLLSINSLGEFIEIIDNGDYYTRGKYYGVGTHNFYGNATGSFTVPANSTWRIVIGLFHSEGYSEVTEETGTDSNVDFNVNVEMLDVKIDSQESIAFRFFITAVDVDGNSVNVNKNITSGNFYNEPLRVPINEGDIVQIKDIIKSDSVLDLLKGAKHLIAGKIDFDASTNTVSLLTQYDANVFGETISGFYQSTVQDFTGDQIKDAINIDINRLEEERYLQIGFAESNDDTYESVSDDNDLYSRVIDRGSIFDEKTKQNRNPYFEPIATKDVIGTSPDNSVPIVIGHATNGEEESYDLAPRIGIRVVENQQRGVQVAAYKLDDTNYAAIPTIMLEKPSDVTITGFANDENLTYGTHGIDLFSIGWQWESALKQFRSLYSISVYGNLTDFKNVSFRKLSIFKVDGRTLPGRVESKSYENGIIKLFVIPERSAYETCNTSSGTGAPTAVTTNANTPQITINFNEAGNTINAVANNSLITSPINTDNFEISTDGGVTFSAYTAGTDVTAVATTFRRTVTYTDGSSQQTVLRSFSPAQSCDNSAVITTNYIASNNSASASTTETLNSTVDTDTFEVSIDSAAYQTYVENDILTNFTTLVFRRTITFTGACPDLIISEIVTAPANACNNYPTLGIVDVGAGLVIPEITGTTSSAIAHVLYQVSENGGTTWKDWNLLPIKKVVGLQLKATVLYCDACQETCLTYICTY